MVRPSPAGLLGVEVCSWSMTTDEMEMNALNAQEHAPQTLASTNAGIFVCQLTPSIYEHLAT